MRLFRPNIEKMLKKNNIAGLVKALQDPYPDVCNRAALALAKIGGTAEIEPLSHALKWLNASVGSAVAMKLGQIGADLDDEDLRNLIVKELVDSLNSTSFVGKYDVDKAVIEALAIIGKQAVRPLISFAQNSTSEYRYLALTALGKSHNPEAIALLITALNDDNSCVRRAASEGLCYLGDHRAVEPLIVLLTVRNREVQEEVKASRQIGTDVLDRGHGRTGYSTPDFQRCSDEHMAIVEALGQIGDPRATESLLNTLMDPRRGLREAAVKALRKVKWKGNVTEGYLVEECKDLIDDNTTLGGYHDYATGRPMEHRSPDTQFLIERLMTRHDIPNAEAEKIAAKALAELYPPIY